MANREQIDLLRTGADAWNRWRGRNQQAELDFSKASLSGLNLYFRADLHGANFSSADLTCAILDGANLEGANMRAANLHGASLRKACLNHADLQGADLSSANLHRVHMDRADLRNTNLEGAQLDVTTCDGTQFHGSRIKDVYYECHPMAAYTYGVSILALAYAEGLDALDRDSDSFVGQFVTDVFDYAHALQSPYAEEHRMPEPGAESEAGRERIISKRIYNEWPHNRRALEDVLARVKLLKRIYERQLDPPDLIRAVTAVNSELLSYLKKHPNKLHELNWRTFEELVAELLSGFGWEVQLTQPSKDNGYDILGIYRDVAGIPHTWIIECKRWAPERKVGVEIARALYAVKGELRVAGALLATTSDFTKGVHDFKSSRYDFELRDYSGIVGWINAYRQ